MKSETLRLFKKSWKFIVPYWKSQEKYFAWGMLALILVLTLGEIGLTVRLTYWTQAFYTALEKRNYNEFIWQIKVFFIVVAIFIPVALSKNLTLGFLQFRWRQWLTNKFLNNWVDKDTYYHVTLHKDRVDNPDQRISQDLDLLSNLSLSLFLSFFKEIVTLFSFAVVLWSVSTNIPLKIFGHTFHIQGYLLWAAFIYAMLGTYSVIKVGQPLINLNFMQQHYEANFRYSLIRLQEKREEIALFGGVKPEIKNLHDAFTYIRENYYSIIIRNMYIGLALSVFVNVSQVIPIIAAAPMYFAGIVTLGVVMQVLRAFEQVRDSFSVIANNFTTIASWRASTKRLLQLVKHMDMAHNEIKHNDIKFKTSDSSIKFDHLSLEKPNHLPILKDMNFSVKHGEKVLIMGHSGAGKSTIIRALRGLWTYGKGNIELPQNIFYVPQRPYMPIATLEEAMLYPALASDSPRDKNRLVELLQFFGLGYLESHLEERRDWSTILSLGEQQRISFIRILINKPKWIVMDEPTSSLNKLLEEVAFKLMLKEIKDITLITVGHSETLKKFHNRVIDVAKWSVT